MRTYKSILAAIGLMLAVSAPASAENAAFWSEPEQAGDFCAVNYLATTTNPGNAFCARFGYDSNGDPTWRGTITSDHDGKHVEGAAFTTTGGQSFGGTYRPTTIVSAGTLSLSFDTGATGGVTDYARILHGRVYLSSDAIPPITRHVLETGAPLPDSTADYRMNGWWWNPAESGTGYAIEIQGNTLFAAIFSGDGRWVATSGAMTSTSLYTGTVTRCRKPPPATTATCENAGTINISITRPALYSSYPAFRPTLSVTLPSGATTTLEAYSF